MWFCQSQKAIYLFFPKLLTWQWLQTKKYIFSWTEILCIISLYLNISLTALLNPVKVLLNTKQVDYILSCICFNLSLAFLKMPVESRKEKGKIKRRINVTEKIRFYPFIQIRFLYLTSKENLLRTSVWPWKRIAQRASIKWIIAEGYLWPIKPLLINALSSQSRKWVFIFRGFWMSYFTNSSAK